LFDIGWTEMMVVAVVAILFVGPKELPGMLRTFGRSIKKLRSMAGDFQKQFDDALKDAELDGVKDTLDEVRNLNPAKKIKDHLNPIKQELDSAKKLVEDTGDFDPAKDFDESKLPDPPKPVEVDVEAALKRQREADAVEKADLAMEAKARNPYEGASKKSAANKPATNKVVAKKAASKSGPKLESAAKAKPNRAASSAKAKSNAETQRSKPPASVKGSSGNAKRPATNAAKAKTAAKKALGKAKPAKKASA